MRFIIITILCLPMMAASTAIMGLPLIEQTQNDSMAVIQCKRVRLVLKNGYIKKNCRVLEINSYWIVYEKEGSLHELMIEEIRQIQFEDGTLRFAFFDDAFRPKVVTIKRKY